MTDRIRPAVTLCIMCARRCSARSMYCGVCADRAMCHNGDCQSLVYCYRNYCLEHLPDPAAAVAAQESARSSVLAGMRHEVGTGQNRPKHRCPGGCGQYAQVNFAHCRACTEQIMRIY